MSTDTTNTNSDADAVDESNENYNPILAGNQRADDLERFCPLCDNELVFEANELLCSECAYAPADDPQLRSRDDEYQDLWDERKRMSARTGPHRKRVVGSFEEAYDF